MQIGNISEENITLLSKLPQVSMTKRTVIGKVWDTSIGNYVLTYSNTAFWGNLSTISTNMIQTLTNVGISVTQTSQRVRSVTELLMDDLVVIGSTVYKILFKQKKQGYYIYILDLMT